MTHTQIKGWLQQARPPVNVRKSERKEFDEAIRVAIEIIEDLEEKDARTD